MIDNDTRCESAVASGDRLTYYFTLVNRPSSDFSVDFTYKQFIPFVKRRICSEENMQSLLRSDIKISYVYYGNDNQHIATVIVNQSECRTSDGPALSRNLQTGNEPNSNTIQIGAEEERDAGSSPEREAEELAQEGKKCSDDGRYVEAVKKLNRALKIDENNFNAYLFRGMTYYRLKRYHDAIADCTKALGMQETLIDALFYRGLSYEQLKQYNNAVKDYNRAHLLEPEEINVLRQRGLVYKITGHLDWARIDFERACQLGSKISCGYLATMAENK
jgi:tetratricopeptide (TPR) repeat protein